MHHVTGYKSIFIIHILDSLNYYVNKQSNMLELEIRKLILHVTKKTNVHGSYN